MAKIKGKFAPLTDELGNDERFIIQSTDLDKLLYVLIMYTCHMTRHKAPKDPRFYKTRYGLRAKTGQIAASLRRLADLYPNVSWGDKNLSLLNSATYKNEKMTEGEGEEELEGEGEETPLPVSHETKPNPLDPKNLLANDLFRGLTMVQREAVICQWPADFLRTALSRYISSAEQKHIFRMNPGTLFGWLERDFRETQKTVKVPGVPRRTDDLTPEKIEQWRKEAAPMPEECRAELEKYGIKSAVTLGGKNAN